MVSQRSSKQDEGAEGFDLSGIDLTVDRDYDLPLGVQLAWKLRALVASGRIAPGERLPSVRALAEQAGVNVNTVRSVYGRLEGDGFLVSRHGLGTFAADPSPATASIENLAAAAVADARAEGLDPRDLATAIYAAAAPDSALPEDESPPSPDRSGTGWDDDDEPPPGSGAVAPVLDQDSDQPAARRELRRQIAKLEGTLSAYSEGTRIGSLRPAPTPAPTSPPSASSNGPATSSSTSSPTSAPPPSTAPPSASGRGSSARRSSTTPPPTAGSGSTPGSSASRAAATGTRCRDSASSGC